MGLISSWCKLSWPKDLFRWCLQLLLETWRSKALLTEMLTEVFSTCEDMFMLPEQSLDLVSGLALLERIVLLCLVHSSQCCMEVYDKSEIVCLSSKPFSSSPRALTLACSTTKHSWFRSNSPTLDKAVLHIQISAVVSGSIPLVYHSDPLFPILFQAETVSFSGEILLDKSLLYPLTPNSLFQPIFII